MDKDMRRWTNIESTLKDKEEGQIKHLQLNTQKDKEGHRKTKTYREEHLKTFYSRGRHREEHIKEQGYK